MSLSEVDTMNFQQSVALLLVLAQSIVMGSARTMTEEERDECFEQNPFDRRDDIRSFVARKDVSRGMKLTPEGDITETAPREVTPLWGEKMPQLTKTSLSCFQKDKIVAGDLCETAYKITRCLFAVQQSISTNNNLSS
ncbi:hypothetical protein FOCC_FOCC016669 [Frankliniella occidentalis]|nr:hypothetical protein FOCC_FOCC016669 [Frankliniella occidentalis]